MDATLIFSHLNLQVYCSNSSSKCLSRATHDFNKRSSSVHVNQFPCSRTLTGSHSFTRRIYAVDQLSAVASQPIQVELTWQIIVGTLAGVTPFVVAGIEFTKRIVAQKRCEECAGSGLVLMEKDYVRCPNCGGFLPWQSWKRFFSG